MNVSELIQQLDLDARIEVFEIDTTPIGGTDLFYFHAGTNSLDEPIVWQGNTYSPFPVQAEGFEKSIRGALPRPKFRVANVTGIMSAVVKSTDDLIGAKFTRRVTFARYLDGQPEADPGQHLPDEVFYFEKKTNENRQMVEWDLASAMDLEGQQLPNRVITPGCGWEYRGPECSYTGNAYFDVRDQSVGSLSLDVCSKTVPGCKARFGERGVLPFGGFPAARTYKM